jgi:hypothetical protein
MVLGMSVRDKLRAEPDIPDGAVDDIVGIAARLKDEKLASQGGASVQEVADVAAELDIEPEYVQAALEQWRAEKASAAQAQQAERAAQQGARRRRKEAAWVGLGLVGVAVIGSLGVAWIGAVELRGAHEDVLLAEAQLGVVLERQAALAPQLVALSGGELTEVSALAQEVSSVASVADRLDHSKALGLAMASGLASAPQATTESQTQLRLNLQHELTGTQNRITAESRRYRLAQAAHRAAASSVSGRLATGYGLAPAPE